MKKLSKYSNAQLCALYKNYALNIKRWVKSKCTKKLYYENIRRLSSLIVLLLCKVVFKMKSINSDKKGQFIMIKVIVHQEDMATIKVHAPNNIIQDMSKKSIATFLFIGKRRSKCFLSVIENKVRCPLYISSQYYMGELS